MTRLLFGLSIDDGALPTRTAPTAGEVQLGPRRLLRWLEAGLGLSTPNQDIEYLRTEQYRQLLKRYLRDHPHAFFAPSFAADDLATAADLLSRRDELLSGGWSFALSTQLPVRLQVMAELEHLLRNTPELELSAGHADRLERVIEQTPRIAQFLDHVQLCDPKEILPPIWTRLFGAFTKEGITVSAAAEPSLGGQSDLHCFQQFLQAKTSGKLKADGSLLLLRGYRETHLAAYLAQLLKKNPGFQPSILVNRPTPTLDHAFSMEGLPALGIPSASLARPSLQVLKLVTVFLWEPIDPYKIMEFVSLSVKPLDDELAQRIAALLADTPGLYSDRWFGMINQFFDKDLPEKAAKRGDIDPTAIRREFDFWFRRKRVDSTHEKVEKRHVREVYEFLRIWAIDLNRERSDDAGTLLALAAQAQKVVDLLDTLPELNLDYLELERIVRTIYESTPINYQPPEAGHLPISFRPGSVHAPVEQLVWWDFVQQEPDYFFSRWYQAERDALDQQGVALEGPRQQNDRLVWQRKRPVLWTQKQLILCLPNFSDGSPNLPHPLLGDLEASFENLEAITLHLEKGTCPPCWENGFQLPGFIQEKAKPLGQPTAFVQLANKYAFDQRTVETPTSLETLLYYPYQWVLRHQIRLRQSSILSVLQDNRLFGNLAHRFLEKLMRAKGDAEWDRGQVEAWIASEEQSLLEKEGATLLLYGREPERISFLKHIKYAAWSLIDLIQRNGWTVAATELEVENVVGPIRIKGRADLVLERGTERAVIDLKWRGSGRYAAVLRNEEDIQLALYAYLLAPDDQCTHTAYYIIEQARMLARNTQAFEQIQAVQEEVDHREVYQAMYEKIIRTYKWRLQQLSQAEIELRCARTHEELEDHYGEALLDLLEMKQEDARFDDYRVLIGAVT